VVAVPLTRGIEAIGLMKDQMKLSGGIWDLVGGLNDNFGALGFMIIGVFVLSWVVSVAVYRVKGFDRLDSPVTATPE
jgi:nickel/cobalt transporter (NiCoT) family protein